MSETDRLLVIGGIAAAATLGAALIAALAAYLATKRDRRRLLYGEAFKAALGWLEMLYRVRRRSDNERDLINQFHDLQEQLTYYEGWIASESRYMARSYKKLVRAVKTGTEPLVTQAWNEDPRPIPGNAKPDDVHPSFDINAQTFLRDVRAYLSPWQIRKLWVLGRNWKDTP